MKKLVAAALLLAIVFGLCGCAAGDKKEEGGYPFSAVTMIIPYGAGGTTDVVGRKFAAALSKTLGADIVVENRGGASGAVGCRAALDAPADGSVILFCAESLGTQRIMGLSDMSYADFRPVMAVANDPKVIVVKGKSVYGTAEELLEAIKQSPSKIRMSYTGPGGSGHVQALIMNLFGYYPALTPYQSGGEGILAVLGDQVDFTNANFSTVSQYIESGDLRMLAVCASERLEGFEDVPALPELIDGIDYYMSFPYVPLSLLAPGDVPEEVCGMLREAALEAVKDAEFDAFMEENHIEKLYEKYTDTDQISEFYSSWESLVSYLIYDCGAAKYDPAQFGIQRLEVK